MPMLYLGQFSILFGLPPGTSALLQKIMSMLGPVLGGALNQAFSNLGTQVDNWLIGIVIAPLVFFIGMPIIIGWLKGGVTSTGSSPTLMQVRNGVPFNGGTVNLQHSITPIHTAMNYLNSVGIKGAQAHYLAANCLVPLNTSSTPTPLYPWCLVPQSPVPNAWAVFLGIIFLAFFGIRLAIAIVNGSKYSKMYLSSLGISFVFLLFAPLGQYLLTMGYNIVSINLLHDLGRNFSTAGASSVTLMFSTLGYVGHNFSPNWGMIFVTAGMLAFGFIGSSSGLSALNHIMGSSVAINLIHTVASVAVVPPVAYLVLWALVMDMIVIQVYAAMFFLSMTPIATVMFGVFGGRRDVALGWARLILRAFLALAVITATDILWLQWVAYVQGGGNDFISNSLGFMSGMVTPLLSLVLYAGMAFILWSVWMKPFLLVIYEFVLPTVHSVFSGMGVAADTLGDYAMTTSPAIAGALDTAATWFQRGASATASTASGIDSLVKGMDQAASHIPGMSQLNKGLSSFDPAEGLAFGSLEGRAGGFGATPGVTNVEQDFTPKFPPGEQGDIGMPEGWTKVSLHNEAIVQRFNDYINTNAKFDKSWVRSGADYGGTPLDVLLPIRDGSKFVSKFQEEDLGNLTRVWSRNGKYYVFSGGVQVEVPASLKDDDRAIYMGDMQYGKSSLARTGGPADGLPKFSTGLGFKPSGK